MNIFLFLFFFIIIIISSSYFYLIIKFLDFLGAIKTAWKLVLEFKLELVRKRIRNGGFIIRK
jgi:cell shape-determining protein MreC